MKKLCAYASVLLMIAACAVDRNDGYDHEVSLAFHPAMHMHVKSDAPESYPQDQTFGVTVWSLPEGEDWAAGADDGDIYMESECPAPQEGTLWLPAADMVWPASGNRLTAIGYSPSDAFGGCSASDGVTLAGFDVLQDQTDLLYTDPQADMDKIECGGVVPMPFRHALAQVSFRVKNRVAADEAIIVRSIRIDDAAHKGNFSSLALPQWTPSGEGTAFAFFEGEHETGPLPEEIGRVWKMIPQTLATNVTVEYEYRTAAGTGFSATLKTCPLQTTLEPGRHYTYTLSVGIDDVKFLQEIIEHRFR